MAARRTRTTTCRIWPPEVATHYMLYETTTEGTPRSPAFATPEELARYCVDNVTWFADQKSTYEHWLRVAQGEWGGPDLMISAGRIVPPQEV
jgi:hypothetical protein